MGIIICYQILYTNVSNYLPQFATLKAIGFTDWYLVGVVLQQAVFLSVLGFLPALAGRRDPLPDRQLSDRIADVLDDASGSL